MNYHIFQKNTVNPCFPQKKRKRKKSNQNQNKKSVSIKCSLRRELFDGSTQFNSYHKLIGSMVRLYGLEVSGFKCANLPNSFE